MLRATLVLGVVVMSLVAVPAAHAEPDVFGGTWTSTDTDGSHQVLTVRSSGGARRPVTIVDHAAGVCGGDPARVSGTASVQGTELAMAGALSCLPGGNALPGLVWVAWAYDGATDTLVDSFGVVWSRQT